jgi:hypothetical protein
MAAPRKLVTIPDLERDIEALEERLKELEDFMTPYSEDKKNCESAISRLYSHEQERKAALTDRLQRAQNGLNHYLLEHTQKSAQLAAKLEEKKQLAAKLADPNYLFHRRNELTSHLEQLQQPIQYQDEDQARELVRESEMLKPYEAARQNLLVTQNKISAAVGKEWNAFQKLIQDFITTSEKKGGNPSTDQVLKYAQEILALLKNEILTAREKMLAIQKLGDFSESISAHPLGKKSLLQFNAMLKALSQKINGLPQSREQLDQAIKTDINNACTTFIYKLLEKEKVLDLFTKIEIPQAVIDASYGKRGRPFQLRDKSGRRKDIDFRVVVENEEMMKQIPEQDHYLLQKGAQLSDLQNLNTAEDILVKIKDPTFRNTVDKHSGFARTIFSTNSDSSNFLKKLDGIKAEYEILVPLLPSSPAASSSQAQAASAAAAAASSIPRSPSFSNKGSDSE